MVDVLMIVFIVVIAIVLIASNIYILYHFCAEEEPKSCSTYMAKGISIIGMMLAWAQVLMLPLDVSNARGEGGGVDMKLFWFIIYMISAIWIFIVIPFMKNYLEADEDWGCWAKFKYSFCFFFATIIILLLILIVLYAFIGTAYIPITAKSCSISGIQSSTDSRVIFSSTNCKTEKSDFVLNVSFPIYVIGVVSFLSWFLFVLFGGIGISAIPLDCIRAFIGRPKKQYTIDEIKIMRYKLVEESHRYKSNLEIFRKENIDNNANKSFFFSKKKRKYENELNLYRINLMKLQKMRKDLRLNYLMSGSNNNILYYVFLLILGILASIVSILWVLQIVLSFVIIPNGKPIYPLMNNLFVFLTENYVSFLAFFIFAIMCLYLLWATVKGNLKFGLRLGCCWRVYPMEEKKTYMNTILFNVGLILFSSFSVTQFCAAAFDDYVTFTDIQLIFSVQIRYLVFFVYFYRYHIFEYALLAFILISFVYLCIKKDTEEMDKLEEIANSNQAVKIK